MGCKFVSKEGSTYKFDLVFTAEEFEAAVDKVYKANRGSIQIDGFRKGKAPRKIIENYYGADVFYSDALNDLFDNSYSKALDELEIEPIDYPKTELSEIKKGEDVVISIEVAGFPEIEVKNYKGLSVEKAVTKIGAKEVKEELERIQKTQSRMETVEGRKTKSGDTVIIDFVGSIDGVEFEGGSAENYELVLGSGQFIPGFEDQLENQEVGADVEVKVTFPEEYGAEDLAGKDAVFMTKIHEIKEEILPEIDDDFASDVSEFETLADFKKDLKKDLQKKADDRDAAIMKDRALEALYNENKIDTPESMIKTELDNMMQEVDQQLGYNGISLENYLQWMGKTVEEFREESKDEAVRRVNTRILLKNIVRLENIDASEEEINEELKAFGAQYGMDENQAAEALGSNIKYFKEDVVTKKAIDFVFSEAKITEPKEEEK